VNRETVGQRPGWRPAQVRLDLVADYQLGPGTRPGFRIHDPRASGDGKKPRQSNLETMSLSLADSGEEALRRTLQ